MGLLAFFAGRKALTASPAVLDGLRAGEFSTVPRLGGTNVSYGRLAAAFERAQSASYAYLYAHQPAVRTVVDLIAENTSQLGLKCFERISDSERESRQDHPAAETMRYPNASTPGDRFIFDLVADFLIFNNAYALKFRTAGVERLTLARVPAHRVSVLGPGFIVDAYRIHRNDGSSFDVAPDDVIHWHRYNPDDPRLGIAPLETLRQVLVEDAVSQTASTELAKNGLQGGYIKRPLEAPEWSDEGRDGFLAGWRNARTKTPRETPVLEEGMEFVNTAISPKDAELLAGREFTLQTVARLYGVPAGIFDDGGSGRKDLRQEFYADVLAPISKKLASQLDLSLLIGEYDATDHYFEFDLNEKLRGDPAARFQAITSAVGAPWLLRNEARALENKPPVEGGDEIITPLNVLVGENPLPAPNVMPAQQPGKPPQDGSYRVNEPSEPKALEPAGKASLNPRWQADLARQGRYIDEAIGLLEAFYARQLRTIKSKGRFDSGRWNRELAADLERLIGSVVEREGGIYVARLGGIDFDSRQVRNYVKAMAEDLAAKLNEVTQRDFEGDRTAREALERAGGERAQTAGISVGARSTGFARTEAAKQAPGYENRLQTWIANTSRHGRLGGTEVPIGSDWGGIYPGSEPRCACSVGIS